MGFNINQITAEIASNMKTEFGDNWAVGSASIEEAITSEKGSINDLLQLHADQDLDLEELKSELEDTFVVIENKLLAQAIANKVVIKKAIDLALNSLLGSASKVL
ncbi:MAG: hypothetical protein Q9M28_09675 [Mariprofundaceae bacterium]|nr:hypothetical protein [Mariprofundaceae bacterium]